jgi:hypothetical protein
MRREYPSLLTDPSEQLRLVNASNFETHGPF